MQAKKLYFGYGSNLDAVGWQEWCVRKGYSDARLNPLTVAALPDHELAFTRRSDRWGCGVLDLRRRSGQLVNGVIFEADDAWAALDQKEGAGRAYETYDAVAFDPDGNEVDVRTYRVKAEKRSEYVKPGADYLEAVRRGYARFGISDSALAAAAENRRQPFEVDGFFLYGTLMRGESRFGLLESFGIKCILLAEGYGRLVNLGQFPGLAASSESREMVCGEFMRFDDVEGVTQELDRVEGFRGFDDSAGSLYRRQLVQVDVGEGRIRTAWTYCFAGEAGTHPVIPSGDWREHRGCRGDFLRRLALEHAADHEAELAGSIASTYPHAMAEDREAVVHSLLPLADAVRRREVSERRLAQASGRWAVAP
jgi:gamma-glutamylcyclotransferase (GGCT)/AIG2-like uncharacterized protein YtfP